MLEVWDVVDKASKRKISDSLTLANMSADDAESGRPHLSPRATVVDVYRAATPPSSSSTPSKKWTYEYVQRELALVPEHIPTCILINFRDYPASKRAIRPEEVEAGLRVCVRGSDPFARSSWRRPCSTATACRALSTFLHIPFLCLKRASLEQGDATPNTNAIVQAQEGAQDGEGVQIRRVRAQNRGGDGGRGGRRGRLGDGERPVDRRSERVSVPRGTAGGGDHVGEAEQDDARRGAPSFSGPRR